MSGSSPIKGYLSPNLLTVGLGRSDAKGRREGETRRANRPLPDGPSLSSVEIETRVLYERIVQFRSNHLSGQAVPSFAALIKQIEQRQRLPDESAEKVIQAVV